MSFLTPRPPFSWRNRHFSKVCYAFEAAGRRWYSEGLFLADCRRWWLRSESTPVIDGKRHTRVGWISEAERLLIGR